MPDGAELIAAERARQIAEEGWTPEHDDRHTQDELARAGAYYALPRLYRDFFGDCSPDFWPWGESWKKEAPNDRIRELVKAGALIAAEIDRLQRKEHTDA